MNQIEPKNCKLRFAGDGHSEACRHDRCAFWDSECLIERLGIDLATPDLASYLLETGGRIEQARETAEAEAAHREFSRRLGREL